MDLANEIIKKTHHKSYNEDMMPVACLAAHEMRSKILASKRFILDAKMSAFLAELASVPFSVAVERRPEVLASLRHSAKLPYPKMFVQLDGHAFRDGLLSVAEVKTDPWGQPLVPAGDKILRDIGWLIEQATLDGEPHGDTVWVREFFDWENSVATLPFLWGYLTSDRTFFTREQHEAAKRMYPKYRTPFVDTQAGMFAHGIAGHEDRGIGVVYPYGLENIPREHQLSAESEEDPTRNFKTHRLVPEFGGVIRYVLAFLATLNDTPKIEGTHAPTKKYFVAGAFRKPVSSTTITLNLPGRMTTRSLAKRLIAAVRKGHHEVRPHHRTLTYKEGGKYCTTRDEHVWSEDDVTGHSHCKHCDARRVWIVLPEGRGDKEHPVPQRSRYYVTHQ